MNKHILTLLGCSGSLALVLAAGSIATAETTQPDHAPVSDKVDFVEITFSAPTQTSPDASQTSVKPQYANVDAASDTIGDLAIAKFRCDCNSCRVAVVQMLQTDQLAL